MGRTRRKDNDLPVRMRRSHGAYFHVDGRGRRSATWTFLGKDQFRAIGLYQSLEAGAIKHADIDKHVGNLKTLNELRQLPMARELNGSGVYFLWKDGALHYIGRSKNVRNRVRYHRTPKMGIAHDLATALACDKFVSLLIEAIHIEHYRPPGNEVFI